MREPEMLTAEALEQINRRDLELLNNAAGRLNPEAEDVLNYQVPIE